MVLEEDQTPRKLTDPRMPAGGSFKPDGTIVDGPDATGNEVLGMSGKPLNVLFDQSDPPASAAKSGEGKSISELIDQVKDATGTREQWPKEKAADLIKHAAVVGAAADRIAELCSSSKARRREAAEAGAFEELSLSMTKFDSCKASSNWLLVQIRITRALEALTKKAEKEDVQEAGGACIHALAETLKKVLRATPEQIESLIEPGIATLRAITRNNKHNTHKLQRAGGLAGWLAEDSSVVPPEMPEKLK